MFQLVLITALGAINPVSTFETLAQCQEAQKTIPNTAQYSTACLPQQSPEAIKRNMEQGMATMQQMMGVMKQFAAEQAPKR